MKKDILIIDDEQDICLLIKDILEDEGYSCRFAHSGPTSLKEVTKRRPSLVLLDIWLGDTQFDGLKILELLKIDHPDLPVLMMSGHGNIETAVSALKKGAYDFLEKPFKSDRLILLIKHALETSRLKGENLRLKGHVLPFTGANDVIGTSPSSNELRETIVKVANGNSRILLEGPFGSGKESIARLIHQKSERRHGPFITLNCSGMNSENLERNLFGSEKAGAFHIGVLEEAHSGTLYLDAVDEMEIDSQLKIARALQRQKFLREEGVLEVEADFRVISSSTDHLEDLVNQGEIKADLYDRISTIVIKIPALKERAEDIEPLTNHFLFFYAQQYQVSINELSEDVHLLLRAHNWPGNVRQLKSTIEWMVINFKNHPRKGSTSKIELQHIPEAFLASPSSSSISDLSGVRGFIDLPLREAREKFERDYLSTQIGRFQGNISKTSEFIGMERSALHRKLRSLTLK